MVNLNFSSKWKKRWDVVCDLWLNHEFVWKLLFVRDVIHSKYKKPQWNEGQPHIWPEEDAISLMSMSAIRMCTIYAFSIMKPWYATVLKVSCIYTLPFLYQNINFKCRNKQPIFFYIIGKSFKIRTELLSSHCIFLLITQKIVCHQVLNHYKQRLSRF